MLLGQPDRRYPMLLQVQEAGPAGGTPLVVMHGTTNDVAAMIAAAPPLRCEAHPSVVAAATGGGVHMFL